MFKKNIHSISSKKRSATVSSFWPANAAGGVGGGGGGGVGVGSGAGAGGAGPVSNHTTNSRTQDIRHPAPNYPRRGSMAMNNNSFASNYR